MTQLTSGPVEKQGEKGPEEPAVPIIKEKWSKGLQSVFFCGMISVDSYTHFEVRKNF